MYEQPYGIAAQGEPAYPPASAPPPTPLARVEASRQPAGLAVAAVAAALGVALSIAGYTAEHAHPASAVRHWHAVMAAGDVGALRTDERLGARAWLAEQVTDLGERDYARVLAIFDHARELGQAEFARLRELASSGGVAAFNALPWQEQQAVTRQSHAAWVYESGFSQVSEAGVVGTWRDLVATPPARELLQRLGAAALSADELSLLAGRAASDPAVSADPMLLALAERRDAEGETALRRLRDQVEREGERAFRRQPWASQQQIDRRSRDRYVLDRGFAAMSAADRARVGSADALLDQTGTLAERLGRQQLSPAEQREIASRTRDAFVAARASYVESTGTRLAQELLRREFGASRFHYETLGVSGAGGRDLLRRRVAHAEVSWDQVGSNLRSLPASLDLRWSPRSSDWRIVDVRWQPRPGADAQPSGGASQAGAPPQPGAQPQMTPTQTDDTAGEGAGE